MQGLLDTQKPLDGQIFNIATMSTRETVAKETRSKIEEAFLMMIHIVILKFFEIFLKLTTYLVFRTSSLEILNQISLET